MNESIVYKRTIVKETIKSDYLEEEREVTIYLPPNYSEGRTYPVIYCQDGEQFFFLGRIATTANQWIWEKKLEPMIIVGIEMKKATRTFDYHPQGSRFQAYKQFFVQELLPYIENKYSIAKTAANRILAGDSLGGTVSLHLAIEYPSLFGNMISLSGAFFETTQIMLKREKDLSWLNIYMVIGLGENEVETKRGIFNILEMNRLTKEILITKHAKLHYHEKEGNHVWGFWQKQIPDALSYFFKNKTYQM